MSDFGDIPRDREAEELLSRLGQAGEEEARANIRPGYYFYRGVNPPKIDSIPKAIGSMAQEGAASMLQGVASGVAGLADIGAEIGSWTGLYRHDMGDVRPPDVRALIQGKGRAAFERAATQEAAAASTPYGLSLGAARVIGEVGGFVGSGGLAIANRARKLAVPLGEAAGRVGSAVTQRLLSSPKVAAAADKVLRFAVPAGVGFGAAGALQTPGTLEERGQQGLVNGLLGWAFEGAGHLGVMTGKAINRSQADRLIGQWAKERAALLSAGFVEGVGFGAASLGGFALTDAAMARDLIAALASDDPGAAEHAAKTLLEGGLAFAFLKGITPGKAVSWLRARPEDNPTPLNFEVKLRRSLVSIGGKAPRNSGGPAPWNGYRGPRGPGEPPAGPGGPETPPVRPKGPEEPSGSKGLDDEGIPPPHPFKEAVDDGGLLGWRPGAIGQYGVEMRMAGVEGGFHLGLKDGIPTVRISAELAKIMGGDGKRPLTVQGDAVRGVLDSIVDWTRAQAIRTRKAVSHVVPEGDLGQVRTWVSPTGAILRLRSVGDRLLVQPSGGAWRPITSLEQQSLPPLAYGEPPELVSTALREVVDAIADAQGAIPAAKMATIVEAVDYLSRASSEDQVAREGHALVTDAGFRSMMANVATAAEAAKLFNAVSDVAAGAINADVALARITKEQREAVPGQASAAGSAEVRSAGDRPASKQEDQPGRGSEPTDDGSGQSKLEAVRKQDKAKPGRIAAPPKPQPLTAQEFVIWKEAVTQAAKKMPWQKRATTIPLADGERREIVRGVEAASILLHRPVGGGKGYTLTYIGEGEGFGKRIGGFPTQAAAKIAAARFAAIPGWPRLDQPDVAKAASSIYFATRRPGGEGELAEPELSRSMLPQQVALDAGTQARVAELRTQLANAKTGEEARILTRQLDELLPPPAEPAPMAVVPKQKRSGSVNALRRELYELAPTIKKLASRDVSQLNAKELTQLIEGIRRGEIEVLPNMRADHAVVFEITRMLAERLNRRCQP